ncbi:hypothetical protein [Ereboglobus luteus]|uniref:Uncharacterized protein n=1 Tax=Ereboglobus luteus TaxID=1796921 RepID=A0A2U8E1D1_9BACT|nr:hypothetical protein [Ereboglobus luteus]AWI08678.1 hypothetical protein CKA38_04880 [Ereboglobus luteus]
MSEDITEKPASKVRVEKKSSKPAKKRIQKESSGNAAYPRHSLAKVLRVPEAMLAQNAGKNCTEKEAAKFVGVGYGGPFRLEISSCLKFGLLDRPSSGTLAITDLARRALRPQNPSDDIKALQEAVLKAPQISEVYEHYRGENLPDKKFFENALIDKFKVPLDKIADFINIFEQSLEKAKLIQKIDDRTRVIDVTESIPGQQEEVRLKKIGKDVKVASDDSCFVMMPFADPIGSYYEKIYEPAILKAGLNPVRADNEIFGTGKIMDQIWSGIYAARILVAELTSRNPNVFYELGLAHALRKPVVLVSATEADVPFDLKHIRVIYYEMTDPFWGQKLMDKVSENILSALKNPEEAILPRVLENK